MANAAIAYTNLIDITTTNVTSSGAVLLAQPTLLKNPHVGKKWRDNTTATYVLADLMVLNSIDTIMLAGVSGVAPTFRVRLSTADSTGAAGDAFDSGSIAGTPYFDPNYGMFVYLLSTPVSARYVRVDISEGGVSFIEAGRWFVGLRSTFGINFKAGFTRTPVRSSVDVMGVGGQTYMDLRLGYWKATAAFDFISAAERTSVIEGIGIAIVNNGHKDMLWIADKDSTNLSRDCIWGYLDQEMAVTQNLYVDPPLYSVVVSIRQRL